MWVLRQQAKRTPREILYEVGYLILEQGTADYSSFQSFVVIHSDMPLRLAEEKVHYLNGGCYDE
jgi:hypothetical protein